MMYVCVMIDMLKFLEDDGLVRDENITHICMVSVHFTGF